MAQIFHHSANAIAKGSLVAALFVLAFTGWALVELNSGGNTTGASFAREQPVPFSHAHHVGGLGVDCRYCHTSVETAAFAGIPPTKTCMNCHSQIWSTSPELEPVRESFRSGRSIQWTRVHDLPDFVYFDHSIHVNKGVGCETCHGRVDRMPLVWQEAPLTMAWCLECHSRPQDFIRPREQVFTMGYQPPANQAELGRKLAVEYKIQDERTLTSCSTCHR